MVNWKEYELNDLIDSINTGLDAIKRASIVEHQTEIRCLRIQDISQSKPFKEWGFTETKPLDYEKYKLKKGDILIARTGNSIGVNQYIEKDCNAVFNNGLARIRVNNNLVLPKFIYYVIQSNSFKNHIISISGGTATQPNMKVGDLAKYKLLLPALNEQQRISDILSKFDDKIQLNTQTNQTLEAIAQAIFKSWFVDFDPVRAKAQAILDGKTSDEANLSAMAVISGKAIEDLSQTEYQELWEIANAFPSELVENAEFGEVPKGWEVKYLKDICNIVYGKNLPTSKLLEQGYPVFGGNGIIGYYDQFLYEEPQTLVSCRGAASGKVLYSLPNSFVTNNSLVIEHKNSGLSSYYIYESLMLQNLSELTSGSAQPQMTIANMNGVKILVPTPIIHSFYSGMVSYFYKSRYEKQIENEKLSIIRDELLPKLLSGEIEL